MLLIYFKKTFNVFPRMIPLGTPMPESPWLKEMADFMFLF